MTELLDIEILCWVSRNACTRSCLLNLSSECSIWYYIESQLKISYFPYYCLKRIKYTFALIQELHVWWTLPSEIYQNQLNNSHNYIPHKKHSLLTWDFKVISKRTQHCVIYCIIWEINHSACCLLINRRYFSLV